MVNPERESQGWFWTWGFVNQKYK